VVIDNVVGIATQYRLNGSGIESRWRRDFQQPSRPVLRLTQPSVQSYWVSFPVIKGPGGAVNHPPPSSVEVKERVELYVYYPSGPSRPVLGRILPFAITMAREPNFGALGSYPLRSQTFRSSTFLLRSPLTFYHLRSPLQSTYPLVSFSTTKRCTSKVLLFIPAYVSSTSQYYNSNTRPTST
jgi:hypothetical protein